VALDFSSGTEAILIHESAVLNRATNASVVQFKHRALSVFFQTEQINSAAVVESYSQEAHERMSTGLLTICTQALHYFF
jgi:hypothetical protein